MRRVSAAAFVSLLSAGSISTLHAQDVDANGAGTDAGVIEHKGHLGLIQRTIRHPHGSAGGVVDRAAIDAAARQRGADFQGNFFDLRGQGLDGGVVGSAHGRKCGGDDMKPP